MSNTTKVVWVTGAAAGLGRAICQAFTDQGYCVVASDIRVDKRETKHPAERLLACDVTQQPSVNDAVKTIRDHYGRLDILINNAGIIDYFSVAESDPEKSIHHFQVNCFGALRTTHAALDLLSQSQGRVINISSESWRLRTPFQIYQSSKLALEGMSDVLRRELAQLGIQVATIRPGAINTRLFHALDDIQNPHPDAELSPAFERFAETLSSHAPTRLSSPEAVANLVLKAGTVKRMKPHYTINNMISLKIMSWLPTRWADRIIQHMLKQKQ